ncbi:transposase [Paenibacillus larvae]|nr:transposase [Paenibacillus larvae]
MARLTDETGHIVWQEDEQSYETFLSFLQKVMATYINRNWLWFWTMPIHHAKLLRPFLEAQKNRLELVLASIRPPVNIVEGLWKWLVSVIANVFYSAWAFPKSVCVSSNLWMKS